VADSSPERGDALVRPVLLAAVVFGIVLRLVWPADMEWKADEQRMFTWASAVGVTEPWPSLGMESGVRIPNPPLSVWIFVPLARAAGNPVVLVQIVQAINVLALLGFVVFGRSRMFSDAARRLWFAGLALQAVNPLAVTLSRKIWAQSLMPAFALAVFSGHAFRRLRVGAFLWGLCGMLAGQVHMSGFVLQAVLAIWTWFVERRLAGGQLRTRWPYWFAGSLVAAIPLWSWLASVTQPGGSFSRDWTATREPRALLLWLVDGLGVNTEYLYTPDWIWFLGEPRFAGTPTYGMAAVHLILAGVALYCLGRWLVTIRPSLVPSLEHGDLWLWIHAAAFGVTALLMLAGVKARTHYVIVLYPLPFVWLAWLISTYGGRRLYQAVLVLQLLISVAVLWQVHRDGGVPTGAYGASYRAQMRQPSTP
jgi:hypothetical protein